MKWVHHPVYGNYGGLLRPECHNALCIGEAPELCEKQFDNVLARKIAKNPFNSLVIEIDTLGLSMNDTNGEFVETRGNVYKFYLALELLGSRLNRIKYFLFSVKNEVVLSLEFPENYNTSKWLLFQNLIYG